MGSGRGGSHRRHRADTIAVALSSWSTLPGMKITSPLHYPSLRCHRRTGLLAALCFLPISWSTASAAPNILLIIGDDMGVEALASYGLSEDAPATPALDRLARDGVRFTNFWAQPVCSPTRATVITGRYGFRTGIGRPVGGGPMPPPPEVPAGSPAESRNEPNPASAEDRALPRPFLLPDEFTLPMALKGDTDIGYATAAFGKWHLAGPGNGWTDHPNLAGFDHFAGLMGGGPASTAMSSAPLATRPKTRRTTPSPGSTGRAMNPGCCGSRST